MPDNGLVTSELLGIVTLIKIKIKDLMELVINRSVILTLLPGRESRVMANLKGVLAVGEATGPSL